MKRNIRLIIAYDGKKYLGWQRLKDKEEKTIQGKIEKCLSQLLDEKIEIIGSGRTDSGTHAKMQVANFWTYNSYELEKMHLDLNKYLPEDIVIKDVKEVAERFHSRFNAVNKTYMYRTWTSQIPPIFERNYVYNYGQELNLDEMRKASELFIGEHDFQAFCKRQTKKSTIRKINSIDIIKKRNEVQISINANGFLYNMARIITGTLIEIGQGSRSLESINEVFTSNKRENAGFTAPAQGLVLLEVNY